LDAVVSADACQTPAGDELHRDGVDIGDGEQAGVHEVDEMSRHPPPAARELEHRPCVSEREAVLARQPGHLRRATHGRRLFVDEHDADQRAIAQRDRILERRVSRSYGHGIER
jgi:hypothetical protein